MNLTRNALIVMMMAMFVLAIWVWEPLLRKGVGHFLYKEEYANPMATKTNYSASFSKPYGGPFELIDQQGRSFSDQSLLGRPAAIFFGFTHCPEICPGTLSKLSIWYEQLGDPDLQIIFVTVDPERDTESLLDEYVSIFTAPIKALTGTPEQIADVAKAWGIYVKKVPLENGDYTVDHTATIFLQKSNGDFGGTISPMEDHEVALKKLENILG
ncbi:MAG: SCO family protein [Pseudomonadota bacterium]